MFSHASVHQSVCPRGGVRSSRRGGLKVQPEGGSGPAGGEQVQPGGIRSSQGGVRSRWWGGGSGPAGGGVRSSQQGGGSGPAGGLVSQDRTTE